MAEPPVPPLRSARIPAGRPGHARVILTCPSCGGATDLTWKLDTPPSSVTCDGCGTELELPRG